MQRFCKFTQTRGGTIIYINPDQVVSVHADPHGGTMINLEGGGSVTVREGLEETVKDFEKAG